MGWDACLYETNQWLRWMECHPGLSGYIQAIGVILTLAGALFGPPLKSSYQSWKYRRVLRQNSDRLAARQRPDIDYVLMQIIDLADKLNAGEFPENWLASRDGLSVKIPGGVDPVLLRNASTLEPGRNDFIADFVEEVRDYNNRLFNGSVEFSEETKDALRNDLVARLEDLVSEASAVLALIDRRRVS